MNCKNSTYSLLKECSKDRFKEQGILKREVDYISNIEYSLFCAWCNAFKDSLYTESNFEEYLNTEKELPFWIKKRIYENFFRYKYEFDYESNHWKKNFQDF